MQPCLGGLRGCPELDEQSLEIFDDIAPGGACVGDAGDTRAPDDGRVGIVELCAAHRSDLRNAGRKAHGQPFRGLGDQGSTIAFRAACVAGSGQPRDTLRARLLGYGPDYAELLRRVADYVAQIFHGASPGELPIEGPTHYEFAINLKTAKTLGLTLPPVILARADEIIE